MGKLSSAEVAKLLNVPVDKLKVLENQGLIRPVRKKNGTDFYSSNEISQIKSRRVQTLSDEANVLDSEIQRETVSSISFFQKIIRFFIIGFCTSRYYSC